MAKADLNGSITGIRGKIGRMIYRKQHGQTVIASAPARDKSRAWTPAQRESQERFQLAQAYAARVLAHPLKRERYRQLAAQRNRPPNTLLIANFLNAPTVDTVELASYDGRAGSTVDVLATDDIEVVRVTVTALDLTGKVLESGAAQKDHDVWTYTCTTALGGIASKLEVTAENRAGTQGAATVAL